MSCVVFLLCMLLQGSFSAASVTSDAGGECSSDSSHPGHGASLLQRSVGSTQLHALAPRAQHIDQNISTYITTPITNSWAWVRSRATPTSQTDQLSSLEFDLDAARKARERTTQGSMGSHQRLGTLMMDREQESPKVAFLFLVTDRFDQEAVWDSFFGQAPEGKYSIYVHRASPQDTTTEFLGKWGAVLVPQVPARWGALSGAEVALFSEALADQANVQFVLLSETTVPLKPFHYVYSQLASKSPDTSKICFTQDTPALNVKHHQWVVLSRRHALSFVEKSELAIRKTYAALQQVDAGCCSDELAVATAILSETAGSDLDEDLKDIGVEKACLTWVSWYDHFNDTPLNLLWWYGALKGASLNGAPHHFGPPEQDPTVKRDYLQMLVKDEGFMFGRKFNSGCFVDDGTHHLPLSTELPALWEQVDADKVSSRVWSRLDAAGMPREAA